MNKPHIHTPHLPPHPWFGVRPWSRHSLVLVSCGLIYVLVGVSYMFAEPSPSRTVALEYALMWLPLPGWGVIFIFTGLLGVLSARWPPVSKTWGYIALTALSAGWSAWYLMGVIFGNAPMTNISNVLTWGLVAFLWWAISGLSDACKFGA